MKNVVLWGSKTHRDLCFSQYALRDNVKESTVIQSSFQTLQESFSYTEKVCIQENRLAECRENSKAMERTRKQSA